MSQESIKIDPSHLQKSGQVWDKIPRKLLFYQALFELYFSSKTNLSFLFSLIFIDSIPVFNPDFLCLKKVSDKYTKSGISLKYALTNCEFYFFICIMLLINDVYSTKKRNKWMQYSINFKLVKLIFKDTIAMNIG